ncbi:MAG: RNA polymerase sigma factor SigZ [Phaeodactylibacter sp.]|nr:RNA polymerase sigma factor SigZ [Phaeodactylibacter sp.]
MEAESIWEKVQAKLKAFVRAKVRDEASADDVLQEIFIKMYQNLHQLRAEEKAEYWLFRIAQNAVNDHFRQRKTQALPVPALVEPAPTEEEEQVQALTEEVAQWLPFMLELLPDKYRQALYLTEVEGISQRELAEKLGISYSGAKSRVQRGREKLRDIVLQCCEVATDKYGNVLGYQPREAGSEENVEEEEEECC